MLFIGIMSVGVSLRAQDGVAAEDEEVTTIKGEEVTAKGVGVVGGIVAGAEVVLVVESIIRLKPLWPYIVIPIAGAVGGGIGGYKLEQRSRGGAIALLITSMVGIIPTLIATSSARSFHPEDVGAQKGSESLQAIDYSGYTSEENVGEDAVVEVEARPDGLPDAPMGPPPPPSTDDTQSEGSDGASDYELNVEPGSVAPESVEPQSRLHSDEDERLAHLSSGALLHMNRDLRFGLGIPAIDVVPVQLPYPWAGRKGVVFHIPLVALDLP